MAHDALETIHEQQEGGDTLYGFLLENKEKLGSGFNQIYSPLKENEITEFAELIEFFVQIYGTYWIQNCIMD